MVSKKEPREIFSKNLNYLFAKYNIEQNVLAEKLGVSPSSITEWVKCRKFPRIDKIQMLAEIFNLSISSLLENDLEYFFNTQDNNLSNEIKLKYGNNSIKLLEYYNQLNDLGKEKSLENIKDLTEVPKYIEKKTGFQEA